MIGVARSHPDAVAVVALALLPFAIFAHTLWRGFATLLVVFARSGADPSDPSEWLFRPALGRASVRPAPTTGAGRGVFAAALGLVAVATCALVVVMRPASR